MPHLVGQAFVPSGTATVDLEVRHVVDGLSTYLRRQLRHCKYRAYLLEVALPFDLLTTVHRVPGMYGK